MFKDILNNKNFIAKLWLKPNQVLMQADKYLDYWRIIICHWSVLLDFCHIALNIMNPFTIFIPGGIKILQQQ